MRRLSVFVGAITVTFITLVSAAAVRGRTDSVDPLSLGALAKDVFHCSPLNLDCGYEARYFTLIDPERRTWQRISSTKPTLSQLVLAFGTPEGTDGLTIVIWQGVYAELAQPIRPDAPVNAVVLEADLPPLTPWRGFVPDRLSSKEIYP